MKNAIILHGWDSSPDFFWFPWLKQDLEKRGYKVWAPQLPHPKEADLKYWVPFVLENGHFDEETVIISHSAGGPLAIAIIEKLQTSIKKAVLVAGWIEPLKKGEPEVILQDSYNFEKIRKNCKEFIFIHSDNDPWGCNDKMGEIMRNKIGGKLIVLKGEGHFGSSTFNQPYKEFPLLLELI